jgi:hypothetical protein
MPCGDSAAVVLLTLSLALWTAISIGEAPVATHQEWGKLSYVSYFANLTFEIHVPCSLLHSPTTETSLSTEAFRLRL